VQGNLDGVVLRAGACPTLERNTITNQARRGVLVIERGQGTVSDNEIAGSADANVEVRGELEREVGKEQAKCELEKKQKVYAAMGLLVPVSTEGVDVRGLLTDESGATTVTLRKNRILRGGVGVRPPTILNLPGSRIFNWISPASPSPLPRCASPTMPKASSRRTRSRAARASALMSPPVPNPTWSGIRCAAAAPTRCA